MVLPSPHPSVPGTRTRRWAVVRGILGLAQMAGAAAALILLARSGLTALALAVVALTCGFTTASVLLFGPRAR